MVPLWEDLIQNVNEDELQIGANIEDDCGTLDGEQSVISVSSNSCLASKKQLRLDKSLQASGFSQKDAMRANELHYYNSEQNNIETVEEEEEGDNEVEKNDENEKGNLSENDEYDGAISDKEDDDSLDEQVEVRVYRDTTQNEDEQSIANFSTVSRAQSYAEAEAIARERVRRHFNDQKKAKVRQGAYRSRNSNKSFNKGKRGFQDFSI